MNFYIKPIEINCVLENNIGRSMTRCILDGGWGLKTLPLETNINIVYIRKGLAPFREVLV